MKRTLVISLILWVILTLAWMAVNAAEAWPDNPASATPSPDEKTAVIIEVDEAIYDAIDAARRDTIYFWDDAISVVGTNLSGDQQWAASILVPINRETDTSPEKEPALVISIKIEEEWQVLFPNDPRWLEAIKNTPDDLLSPAHKEVYINMNTVAAVNMPAAALGGYLLPWDDGSQNGKYLTGSTCHDDYIPSGNAHYAFDFAYNGTMWDILAAKAGEVWVWKEDVPTCYERTCSGEQSLGNYIVLRDTSTNPVTYQLYLHLKQDSIPNDIKVRGYPIVQGQYIGNVDNTGQSWGSHLHFQVQVPYITVDYYWGRSVDITFNDVNVNGGRPRIHQQYYCWDFNYCDEPGDVCEESQLYYTSQNIRTGTEDSTPPVGGMLNPLTGETYDNALPLEAWARDLGDPGKPPIGIQSAQFIAFYNGTWRDVGPSFIPTPSNIFFEYDWNWCTDEVPDGPVSMALRLRDYRGNQTPGLPGLRHVTKQYECPPQPPGPTCAPTNTQVALFSQINYQGDCQILSTGVYTNSTFFGSVGNNNTRSIRVGSLVQAELFSDDNLSGRSETIRAHDSNLGENQVGSATTSSLRVNSRTVTLAATATSDFLGTLGNLESAASTETSATAPYNDAFEGDTSGWTSNGLWHLSHTQSHSTSHSWRYGSAATNNYNTGGANSGSLTSPLVTLPVSANPYVLQFWYRYQTESLYPHWDQRWLQISVDGGPFSNAYQLSDDPMGGWLKVRIDLLPLYGPMNQEHTIQVRFYFQTIDGYNNDFEGWFIDDIQIQAEAVTACPSDPHEVNDTPAQAADLGFNSLQAAAICPGWDVDYYKFIGLAGERIIVDVDAKSSGSEVDGYLFLLDSDGSSELAESDDEVLFDLQDPFLSYRLPRSGQYYLKLRAWDHPSGSGEYTLKMLNDAQAPAIQLIHPTENGGLTQGLVTLSAQASDAQSGIAEVQFWVHNSDWLNSDWYLLDADNAGSDGWSAALDTSGFPVGSIISIYAKAFDRAGNWSPAAAWKVVIDVSPPTITLNPLQNPSESSALHLTWQASDSLSGIASVSLDYKLNNGSWIPWSTTQLNEVWYVGQPGNTYTFRATAQDHASNTATSGTVSSLIPVMSTLCSSPDAWDTSASINDNSFSNATSIALGDAAQPHNFCNPATSDRLDDQDWLTFSAEQGKRYGLAAIPEGKARQS